MKIPYCFLISLFCIITGTFILFCLFNLKDVLFKLSAVIKFILIISPSTKVKDFKYVWTIYAYAGSRRTSGTA